MRAATMETVPKRGIKKVHKQRFFLGGSARQVRGWYCSAAAGFWLEARGKEGIACVLFSRNAAITSRALSAP
jgi:hypothetical protein